MARLTEEIKVTLNPESMEALRRCRRDAVLSMALAVASVLINAAILVARWLVVP